MILLTVAPALPRERPKKTIATNTEVTDAINPLLPEERRAESLSRKALCILMSTPGGTSVLNGMRRPEQVDDSIAVLGWPALDSVHPVYLTLRGPDV